MPDDDTWPPKPALPDPLTEYDDVIAAKLAALSETKTGANNIHLIKALRDEEGIELSRAYAAVSNYYARNGAPAQTTASKVRARLGCLVPLSMLGLAVFDLWLEYRRAAIIRLPHHHAASLVIRREGLIVVCALLSLALLNAIIMLPRTQSLRKK